MSPQKYKIIGATTHPVLVDEVNRYLERDYVPLGNPYCDGEFHYQAMILPEKDVQVTPSKYLIIKDSDIDYLNEKVSSRIREGWLLYGTPFLMGVYLCQAMVRYPLPEGSNPEPVRNDTRQIRMEDDE